MSVKIKNEYPTEQILALTINGRRKGVRVAAGGTMVISDEDWAAIKSTSKGSGKINQISSSPGADIKVVLPRFYRAETTASGTSSNLITNTPPGDPYAGLSLNLPVSEYGWDLECFVPAVAGSAVAPGSDCFVSIMDGNTEIGRAMVRSPGTNLGSFAFVKTKLDPNAAGKTVSVRLSRGGTATTVTTYPTATTPCFLQAIERILAS